MFKRTKKQRKPPVRTLTHLFHGVETVPGSRACAAVLALSGQRFLSAEAPLLPLEDCMNRDTCTCTYKHFADRRSEGRRDSDAGLPQTDFPEEKRRQAGRRITDG